MAEPSDPHKDLAGVLHDVSNALTVLLGWVGEARAPGATSEAIGYALTIVEQRARIARDLARHAIGAPRIEEQREIGAVLAEIAEALKVEAARTGAVLAVGGGESTAKVVGALDVSQVLTNLVINGLAFAGRGGKVEVAVELEDETCVVHVTDDGPGVPEERRETIFRGDSTRSGGTGVGLRHSRALARAWGGDVTLVGSDKGARFRVVWPRADATPRPPVSTSRIAELVGMRVLVVEDDAAVTQLLEAALDARGAEITVAKNERELERALGEDAGYDAALVDLSPIAGDPRAALARLRERSPKARIILVTGSADSLPEAIANESLELVRKPFEVREIVAALSPRGR